MNTRTKVSLGSLLLLAPLLPAVGVWYVMQYRLGALESQQQAPVVPFRGHCLASTNELFLLRLSLL